jgi:hypothetical protein
MCQNFRSIMYEISVTEFQKRGLLHAHIVIKVSGEPPLSILNTLISAELPDSVEKPTLYAAVKRFHTPSTDHLARPTSRCNRNGNCIYGYPKPITPHTYIDDLGRVRYRRRKEEDRWVIFRLWWD